MTTLTAQDHLFMREALDLAALAYGISDPNPRVGCVIVKQGQIIGRGHTQAAGSHHAEIIALQDAQQRGADVTGAAMYVTLEPCCHFGKTPPCTAAIIDARIAKVVIAASDPNPMVAGKGIHLLKAQGLEVETGLLELQALMQNLGFMKRMREGLPWVRLKVATSIDGISALPNGVSQWITSEAARADGHQWRARANVLLTGIGTVLADNPQLNVRGAVVTQQPLRVIIDSYLDIRLDCHILHNGPTLICCADNTSSQAREKIAALKDLQVPVVALPNAANKVDLPAVMRFLAQEHSANEIHVEAGYKLNGSLIRENCVDELLIYMAPKLLGTGAGVAHLGPFTALSEGLQWKFVDQQLLGDDIRLRLMRLK